MPASRTASRSARRHVVRAWCSAAACGVPPGNTKLVSGASRGDLAGLILGSTAHKVIHLTDRPVLIVR